MLQAYYILLYYRYSGAVHACWTAGPATQGESEMSQCRSWQCKSRRKFARLISSSHLIVWSGELDRRCPWEVDLQRLIFSFIQELDYVSILLLRYVQQVKYVLGVYVHDWIKRWSEDRGLLRHIFYRTHVRNS